MGDYLTSSVVSLSLRIIFNIPLLLLGITELSLKKYYYFNSENFFFQRLLFGVHSLSVAQKVSAKSE